MTGPQGFREVAGSERVTMASRITVVMGGERGQERYLCKRLAPRALGEPWMRELLAAEGRLLALLEGGGAPRLVAAGEDGGGPWIVMELVDAPPLSAGMGERDAGATERATRAVFRALAAVHAQGVVHSDVSPGNVLLELNRGHAKLIDFGLARWHAAPPLPPGPFRGTLLYAAPELARGEPFDARANLFATATSLLHVHSGEPPRSLAGAAMLLAAGEEPVDAWAARASESLAAATRDALLACCAFDRTARPASAEDVVRSLGSAIETP